MKFLITGGAGFIGSAMTRLLLQKTGHDVLNIDKLSYAGNLASLSGIERSERYSFIKQDISDKGLVQKTVKEFQPDRIINLAAETHVDRSLSRPEDFIRSNIIGTFNLLEASRSYLGSAGKENFMFLHVSTDEVFGSLKDSGKFKENTAYDPSSPYSASKASSDHLVRAWCRSFNVPTIVSNCSNNYGPFQFPEKLIPLTIIRAIRKETIPIYGNGQNIRDWLYVEDHAKALYQIALKGKPGETYAIGGNCEKTNLQVVQYICDKLQEKKAENNNFFYSSLIRHVADRPGHDFRYAIDTTKIKNELDWQPTESFKTGIDKTIDWYLNNEKWCAEMLDSADQKRTDGV